MKLDAGDLQELKPLIVSVILETLKAERAQQTTLGDRLAFPEAEAARLIGVGSHVLRDARLAGELESGRAGKRIVYTREQLLAYLARKGNA